MWEVHDKWNESRKVLTTANMECKVTGGGVRCYFIDLLECWFKQ